MLTIEEIIDEAFNIAYSGKMGPVHIDVPKCIASSEINLSEKHNYPLIDSIKQTVTNPRNLIEDSAHDGWVRGGLSSREHSKITQNNQ